VWQSLRLNLPVTSYRDILVKGSDLIVGTYGRGIWILDEFTVLRQMTPAITAEPVHLFKPEPAVRVRRNVGFNTPFPPEVPHALNPPDGVVIYYWLKSRPAGEITLDVTDSAGALVRHLSSTAPAPVKEAAKPLLSGFWLAPPETLSTAAGTNRAAWDLRYDPPPVFAHSYAINANPGLTPASPVGALAPPGRYTITLTVDGRRYEQPATIISDPRSPVNTAAILAQVALLGRIQSAMRVAWNGYEQATAVNAALAHAMPADSTSALAKSLVAFRAAVDSVAGDAESAVAPDGSPDDGSQPVNFVTVQGRLAAQFFDQDNGDLAPTESMLQGFAVVCHDLANVAARWQSLNMTKLPELNAMLAKNGAPAIPAAAGVRAPKC
jgi:hypothetical protein